MKPRKDPAQSRSRALVDALLEATARVLESDADFTIQSVCTVAGVSPGSFYQYFPHKEALVYGLLRRHAADVSERMLAVLAVAEETPTDSLIQRAVDAFVDAHSERTGLHARIGRLVATTAGPGLEEDLLEPLEQAVASVMRARPEELRDRDPELLGFLLVRTLEGTVHAAARDRPALLGEPDFRERLTTMLRALVA